MSAVAGSGTAPACSNSTPLWTSSVASPPSSRIMFGPPVGPASAPARCTTSTPRASRPSRRRPARRAGCSAVPSGPTATAAAAWSCVEKMLHDAQRTSAPRATSVSMSTAVWIVMCSEPVIRAPVSGLRAPYSRAQRHQAGHLVLGELDLLAAQVGERQVGDPVVGSGERAHGHLGHLCLLVDLRVLMVIGRPAARTRLARPRAARAHMVRPRGHVHVPAPTVGRGGVTPPGILDAR